MRLAVMLGVYYAGFACGAFFMWLGQPRHVKGRKKKMTLTCRYGRPLRHCLRPAVWRYDGPKTTPFLAALAWCDKHRPDFRIARHAYLPQLRVKP